jgi:hypothetical protein
MMLILVKGARECIALIDMKISHLPSSPVAKIFYWTIVAVVIFYRLIVYMEVEVFFLG